ncbi:four helix bundle protein [Nonlabens dokdonensis]|jgi:four helix bundle protein|uniref:Four helix bundle protein n=1 Tax=Nonlabens dokdonensis TaxID=328515 RepID=A0A1Z8AM58_9FLAO|nr:four helix bundle protein [Nonlabens dokdonensis]OUS11419.1 four helix bundle protein [Nonlabens dokdonensis]
MKSDYHFKFEDLLVYQKAMSFGEEVDQLVINFPQRELYALSSQFRRAADSIALNIAEGYPGSDAQFVKHINHALHSSNECVSANEKALKREYISYEQREEIRKQITIIQKMLTSLRSIIRQRLKK